MQGVLSLMLALSQSKVLEVRRQVTRLLAGLTATVITQPPHAAATAHGATVDVVLRGATPQARALQRYGRDSMVLESLLAIVGSWSGDSAGNNDAHLRCFAQRALANLGAAPHVYGDDLVPLYIPQLDKQLGGAMGSAKTDVDVVFVHGLRGGPLLTWRVDSQAPPPPQPERAPMAAPPAARAAQAPQLDATTATTAPERTTSSTSSSTTTTTSNPDSGDNPGEAEQRVIWPMDWLPQDLLARGLRARVISVAYEANILEMSDPRRCLPLEQRARELTRELARAGVGEGGRPVLWVTHSLGGLVVKQVSLCVAAATPRAPCPVHATLTVHLCHRF